jgi:hypothetical protein
LTDAKRRPALVIAELSGDDLILCQITSQNVKDHYSKAMSARIASSLPQNKYFFTRRGALKAEKLRW